MSFKNIPFSMGGSHHSLHAPTSGPQPGMPMSSQLSLARIRVKDEDRRPGEGRLTLALVITAAATIIGGSFPNGWNTGVLNGQELWVKRFINSSLAARGNDVLEMTADSRGVALQGNATELWVDYALVDGMWAITNFFFLLGGVFGAITAGLWADKFGRKKAIMAQFVFIFISSILFGACKAANSLEMLIVARFFVGYGCGTGSALVPMYLTESAPINIRGAMGVLYQLAVTIGIFSSQVFGLTQLLGTEDLWPYLLALTAAPSVVALFILPFFPDSPRYLYVVKNDEKAAAEALRRFRGRDDIDDELQLMKEDRKRQQTEPAWTFAKLFQAKHLRLPIFLGVMLGMGQQLSGINVVFYYSNMVFRRSGISADHIQYAIVGTGAVNVVMTVITVPLIERLGRRMLLLIGCGLMIVSMVAMTIGLKMQDTTPALAYVTVIGSLVFIVGFSIGLGPIPFFICAELFKDGPRPAAMSFAGLLNWACNLTVSATFPYLEKGTGPYCWLLFLVILVLFWIMVWHKLPETKDKTYDEIYRLLGIKEDRDDSSAPEQMEPLRGANQLSVP